MEDMIKVIFSANRFQKIEKVVYKFLMFDLEF